MHCQNASCKNEIQCHACVHPQGLPERGLIIDEKWIVKILTGEKTWEMRTTKTKIRGRIGLIMKGSGLVVGEAILTDSLDKMSDMQLFNGVDKHCIHSDVPWSFSLELAKWRYPWVLKSAVEYDVPVPYKHPQGAVIWVKL